jgi:4-amino-4-deoxy-L-arabinose transferase-like glycosyltransferase
MRWLSARRVSLVLVLGLFCLPLFVGLGRGDVGNDEAIYSFAVDRILETGDWLNPRSSTSETVVFLEKPPLKFWIVAAPIRLGLLPHDEFGLRFWDAAFGALAFLYVFGLGTMLAGPLCGLAAVFILFVHPPLLFDHGLRSNNMEAALFLSYCGGIFHFLRWAVEERPGHRRAHAAATGLYFVLGFMTKFVAAIFLPVVIGLCALVIPSYRAALGRDWRAWTGASLLVIGLCAPWFVYAQIRFGRELWETMIGAHVFQRFTRFVDPLHVEPWSYYAITIYERFTDTGAIWLVAGGLLFLLVESVRQRRREGAVVLAWAVVPLVLISFGTSKLYHYAYPFLPPLALAGGYLIARVIQVGPALLGRVSGAVGDGIERLAPPVGRVLSGVWVRRAAIAVIAIAGLAAIVGAFDIPIRFRLSPGVLVKNTGNVRPLLALLAIGVLTRVGARVSVFVIALVAIGVMPLAQYGVTLARLSVHPEPLKSLSSCLQRVESSLPQAERPGIYVDVPDQAMLHPLYYYFRRVQPWERAHTTADPVITHYLQDPGAARPVLIWQPTFQQFLREHWDGGPARAAALAREPVFDSLVLLPGPYAVCGRNQDSRIRR